LNTLQDSEENKNGPTDLTKKLLLATKAAGIGLWEYWYKENHFICDDVLLSQYNLTPSTFGGTYEELMEYFHLDDKIRVYQDLKDAYDQNSNETEFRVIWKDKSLHYIKAVVIVERDSEGNPEHLIGTHQDVTPTKRIQEVIKDSELHMAEAQRLANIGSWSFDFKKDRLIWSDQLYIIFGTDKETFLETHKSFIHLVEEGDRNFVEQTSIYTQQTGEPFKIEYGITTSSGEKRVIEEHGYGQRDAEGVICKLFGTAQDITERKKTAKIIEESEAKYRTLIESSLDCIFLAVKGGNVLTANATARHMFQMTEKELCDAGRSLVDQTDPRFQVLLEERERTGKARGELTFIRKDGTRFPAEASSVIFKDAEGLEKTSMTIRDITERKLAEEKVSMTSAALQQTLTDLNRIMTSSLDIICTINEDGKFAKVSAASEKIWGYTPAQLHEKITIDMVFKEDVEKTMKVASEVMEGSPVHLFENRVVHKNGSLVPMLWSARWDMDHKLMYCIAKDATEIKRLEEERMKIVNDLIQRNKELEQFTYIVSHNLRAPVANIMGFAEALENNSYSENLKKEVLSQLAVSVSKLDEVTRDLNEVLLIKEHVNDVREELSFSKLVENIQISIQNLLDECDIKIETDFSEVDKLVSIKSFIHSIFYNLITNSIKYRSLDKCPFIFIKSYKSHEGTQLIYSDNGFGIDLNKHQHNIFGLYKRFHQHIEGKGVGLFMIKSQIETLGGTIQLNSAVNRGAVFQIYLPFQTAKA